MKDRVLGFFVFFGLFMLAGPVSAAEAFCACCAERGTYMNRTTKLSKYERDEIGRLAIDSAEFFQEGGEMEKIPGLKSLREKYSAGFTYRGSWKFDFTDTSKSIGTLDLMASPTVVDFRTDLYDSEPASVVLYKELRFKSKVKSGTGDFAGGITPATEYSLVLQGRGNQCMNAEDFSHWRLDVKGPKAAYSFFGKLKTKG